MLTAMNVTMNTSSQAVTVDEIDDCAIRQENVLGSGAPVFHDINQGAPEWFALRAQYFTASEAPAMLGVSKYMKRAELIAQKTRGTVREISSAKQALFDRGHQAEADARPIAEAALRTRLPPVVVSRVVDGIPLLASLDGYSREKKIVWENKLANPRLVANVKAGQLDAHYWPQLEQQLLVTGAHCAYFTASNGTAEGTVGMWYISVPERRKTLVDGWHAFKRALAEIPTLDDLWPSNPSKHVNDKAAIFRPVEMVTALPERSLEISERPFVDDAVRHMFSMR